MVNLLEINFIEHLKCTFKIYDINIVISFFPIIVLQINYKNSESKITLRNNLNDRMKFENFIMHITYAYLDLKSHMHIQTCRKNIAPGNVHTAFEKRNFRMLKILQRNCPKMANQRINGLIILQYIDLQLSMLRRLTFSGEFHNRIMLSNNAQDVLNLSIT